MAEEENKITKETVGAPTVQTFTSDMVQVIEDGQGGLIKKIIEEQEKNETEKKNFSPQSRRNRTFVLLSLILILLSTALLAFIYIGKLGEVLPLPPSPELRAPIIYTDSTKTLLFDHLTNEQIVNRLLEESVRADIKQGAIEGIFGTENSKIVGLRRFITLIKSSFVPGDKTFVDDNFLLGSANGGTRNFFILLKVRSFVDIFTPMRDWEPAMFNELHGLFSEQIDQSTSYLLTKSFEDGIVDNKNARILYDNAGKPALMYVFADDHSVVIARDRDTINEVILRITGSQIKK